MGGGDTEVRGEKREGGKNGGASEPRSDGTEYVKEELGEEMEGKTDGVDRLRVTDTGSERKPERGDAEGDRGREAGEVRDKKIGQGRRWRVSRSRR